MVNLALAACGGGSKSTRPEKSVLTVVEGGG
jgi:hypothetical protein